MCKTVSRLVADVKRLVTTGISGILFSHKQNIRDPCSEPLPEIESLDYLALNLRDAITSSVFLNLFSLLNI